MRYPLRVLVVALVAMTLVVPAGSAAARQTRLGVKVPHFIEESARAGVDHVYDGEWEYFVGGGVATFDCDDDGRLDLYFAGGTNSASLYRNQSPDGGALRFTEVRQPAAALSNVTGAYPLDIDSDGQTDLAVLRRGENVLLRGLGDCAFERANEAWSFDGGKDWTTAFSATWEQGSPLPTLAIGNYVAPRDVGETWVCADNSLFRADPSGHGYATAEALTPAWCTLSMLFSDWDRSGQADLRISNDRHYYTDGQEQLWRIRVGEPPEPYTQADGWQPLHIEGMGIASQDITGDGYPELYLTGMGDNKLQTFSDDPRQPSYRDIALKRGVTATRPAAGGEALPSTSWHAEFDDLNNDGRMDLFVTKGNVEAMPDSATKDPNDLFLGRPDGSFVEVSRAAGILHFERTRGAAVVDLNADGRLDIVEVNRRVPAKLWRNTGATDAPKDGALGNWLAVELSQPAPNVDAIGAWIEVRAHGEVTARELTVGGGHASGELGPVHFGLGDAKRASVQVHWPDGETSEWVPVKANRVIHLEQHAGALTTPGAAGS